MAIRITSQTLDGFGTLNQFISSKDPPVKKDTSKCIKAVN